MMIAARLNGILLAPTAEWKTVEQEHEDLTYRLNMYIAVLAAIPAIAGFLGFSAIGVVIPSGATVRVPVMSGLFGAVFGYLMSFVAVYVLAFIANTIAPRFDGQKNFWAALKLVAYSYTAVWIAGIFLLVPGLWFLAVLGIYGYYPLRQGLPQLMKVPEQHVQLYSAVIVSCAVIIRILVGWTESTLFSLPQVI
jgi:hypothetical protein